MMNISERKNDYDGDFSKAKGAISRGVIHRGSGGNDYYGPDNHHLLLVILYYYGESLSVH